jgi:hypothetical protein
MIDRRTFVAGTAFVVVAPVVAATLETLPSAPSACAAESRLVFMINGWSIPDARASAEEVWITIGHSWRTAWR